MTTELTEAQADGLRIARALIDAGIPVFAAAPCPPGCKTPGHANTEYHKPNAWQKIRPSMKQLERWKPGWALAAVGGSAADFLDQDDHHGGDVSTKEIREQGNFPRVFGIQTTPSGGRHYLISPLDERKKVGLLPGLDYQGGRQNGEGRGFVWIAPTVKRSKNAEDKMDDGSFPLGTYEWEMLPDLEQLEDFAGSDDSGQHLRDLVVASHGIKTQQKEVIESTVSNDPFVTASQVQARGETRRFTEDSAWEFIQPALKALREAVDGEINERTNSAAVMLSHFVPAFMNADTAMHLLREALKLTVYDGATWDVERFATVLDGREKIRSNWKAEKVEADSFAGKAAETVVTADAVEALISRMLTADQMASRPAPEPLVWGLLDRDSLAAVVGMPGSFKSFWALDLAGHIGQGRDWHGHRVHQGLCVYIAAEGDRGMTLRTRAWVKKYGAMQNVLFLPEPVQINDAKAWDVLVGACERLAPVFVVADTQSMMTLGMEENSNSEMNVAMNAFRRIQRASNACVLAVHHTTKDGSGVRGGSAQEGAHDTRIRLARKEPRKSMVVGMRDEKQKDMAEGEGGELKLIMEVVDLGVDPDTGRPLSSLVLSDREADAFEEAAGEERPADIGQEEGIGEPQPWTWKAQSHGKADMQRRILQTLADAAHGAGITEARARALVAERWHGGQTGRGTGRLNMQAWTVAWGKVAEIEVGTELLVVSAGGERRKLSPVALEDLTSD